MPHPALQPPVSAPSCTVSGSWCIGRRDFLKASAASLFGLALAHRIGAADAPAPRTPTLRFGMLTDPHYADADSKGSRFYRESLGKVRVAVERLKAERVAFLACLGDMKDMGAGESEARTFANLVAIEKEIQGFGGPTYHVLGNHDMDNLSKAQVVGHITNTGITPNRSYYAFSRDGLRFIALDATYDKNNRDYDHGKFDWKDSNVPPEQLTWLAAELAAAKEPVITFVHQRLDGTGDTSIRNREAVRKLLETSGKVLAVFQGHDHPGFHTLINGIHYYTLRAVIEGTGEVNNAFAIVEVSSNFDLTVTGHFMAKSQQMPHRVL